MSDRIYMMQQMARSSSSSEVRRRRRARWLPPLRRYAPRRGGGQPAACLVNAAAWCSARRQLAHHKPVRVSVPQDVTSRCQPVQHCHGYLLRQDACTRIPPPYRGVATRFDETVTRSSEREEENRICHTVHIRSTTMSPRFTLNSSSRQRSFDYFFSFIFRRFSLLGFFIFHAFVFIFSRFMPFIFFDASSAHFTCPQVEFKPA
jgi:hypothetical protein